MQKALIILVLIIGPVAAFVTIVMLPRWFPRRLHGHRIWRLRDAIVDDVIANRLPRDHPAVRQLVQHAELALRARDLTLLDVYIFQRACRGVDPSVREAMDRRSTACSLEGLTPEQRANVEQYRESFAVLIVGSMLLGSWFGLAHVVRFFPRALTHQDIRLNRLEVGVRSSARNATDMATTDTRLGRRIADVAEHMRELLMPDAVDSRRELVGMR